MRECDHAEQEPWTIGMRCAHLGELEVTLLRWRGWPDWLVEGPLPYPGQVFAGFDTEAEALAEYERRCDEMRAAQRHTGSRPA